MKKSSVKTWPACDDLLPGETWVNLVGVPEEYCHAFQVSNCGRVRSFRRIISQHANMKGYPTASLHCNRRKKTFLIHRLVAMAFLGLPANGLQVNHKDGNKRNNHVGNLEWVTGSYNISHAWRTGLKVPTAKFLAAAKRNGKKSTLAARKLTPAAVIAIRAARVAGASCSEISRRFHVGESTIQNIFTGRNYGDVS